MSLRWLSLAAWIVAALPVSAHPLPPVQGLEPQGTAGTYKTAVDLVTLNVAVLDGKDRLVTGLSREDFEVLEDGVRQDIAFFAAVEIPLDVILLLDTSSSMVDKMAIVRGAARRFVKTLKPGDRGAVVSFNTSVRVQQGFTQDLLLLDQAIESVRPGGGTALYTGLYVALDHFSRLARKQGEVRKSAIVVLSDGDDTGSLISQDDLLERARRAGVPIYPISVVPSEETSRLTFAGRRRAESGADFALRVLAKETGARAFFPTSLEELTGVYELVAKELTAQYSIGYSPSAAPGSGEYRRLLVRIPSRPDARPRTRAGYYLPGPSTARRQDLVR